VWDQNKWVQLGPAVPAARRECRLSAQPGRGPVEHGAPASAVTALHMVSALLEVGAGWLLAAAWRGGVDARVLLLQGVITEQRQALGYLLQQLLKEKKQREEELQQILVTKASN